MSRPFAAALALVLLRAATLAHSAWHESVSYDECEHLYAGYRIWTAGDWSVNPHAPAAKLLCGLPAVALGATQVPPQDRTLPGAPLRTAWAEARAFLHHNVVAPATLLRAARAPSLALWALLGLLVFGAARALHGPGGSWLALGLYLACPQLATYGRVVSTDLPLALGTLGASLALMRWWATPGPARALVLGVCLGVAFASRQTAAIPAAALAVTALVAGRGRGDTLRRPARDVALALAVLIAVVGASYGGTAIAYYARGIDMFARAYYGDYGHDPYFFAGHTSERGWWWYFPAAVAVKHAPGHLLVVAITLGSLAWRRPRATEWAFLAPALALAVASGASGINYSVRHLLPIWPLLYVFAGRLVGQAGSRRWWVALPVLASALELGLVHPHYQGYASSLVGGPAHGTDYLVDNSIDAGQALGDLDRWLADEGDPPVWLAYFGQGDPACPAYAIPFRCLPVRWDSDLSFRETRPDVPCPRYLAISANYLRLWNGGTYEPLIGFEPVTRPGWAIHVYDLERDPSLRVWLTLFHVDGARTEMLPARLTERTLSRAVELLRALRHDPALFDRTRPDVERYLASRADTRRLYAACLARAGLAQEASRWRPAPGDDR